MKIHYEDNHLILIDKVPHMPTQEDASGDFDTLSMVRQYIKETYNKPGNVYTGLVHRLDRPVGGLMVFAKTSKAASRLSDQIRRHNFDKTYIAVVEGNVKLGLYKDYMYKDRKSNTSYVCSRDKKDAKEALLEVVECQYNSKEDLSLVKIHLITGRSHQIRVQFASRNHPLWGDARYNKNAIPGQDIALWSHGLEFEHPTTKKHLTFNSQVPDVYPYNLFK